MCSHPCLSFTPIYIRHEHAKYIHSHIHTYIHEYIRYEQAQIHTFTHTYIRAV